MSLLTIRPVTKLFTETPGRTTVKINDLRQIWQRVHNQLDQKLRNPQQAASAATERKYLAVLEQLMGYFVDSRPVAKKFLRTELDKILRAEHFNYEPHSHSPANINRFNPKKKGNIKPGQHCFDLALYNDLMTVSDIARPESSHHTLQGHGERPDRLSVCYSRCEPFGDGILIGNMQIDQAHKERWQDPESAGLLLKRKNLYQALVAETLRHVLQRGYKNIMFQCGDAVNLAQEFERRVVTLTAANFPRYQRQYERALANFSHAQVGSRQRLNRLKIRQHDIIYARDDKTIKTYHVDLVNGVDYNQFLPWVMATQFYVFPNSTPGNALERAAELYLKGEPRGLASIIDRLFDDFKVTVSAPDAEKIAALKKICCRRKTTGTSTAPLVLGKFISSAEGAKFLRVLQGYLRTFGYEDKFLARFSKIIKIPPAGVRGPAVFINLRMVKRLHDYHRADVLAPQVGKAYTLTRDGGLDFLVNWRKRTVRDDIARTIVWYDRELPEVLDKFKLQYRRVPIASAYKQKAHAWQITSGLEEFAAQPHEAFARRAQLKSDTVTLPQLTAAGDKFGLSPAQIVVVNSALADSAAWRALGKYTATEDKIYLANRSLSILAHEGFHRLKRHNLVPAREYFALVRAGQRLTASAPGLCPPGGLTERGAARDEEFAALFVEKYFTDNQFARQALCGAKIKITEQIFEYIRVVIDLLKSCLGNDAALARTFLRRIVHNEFAPPHATRCAVVGAHRPQTLSHSAVNCFYRKGNGGAYSRS